MPESYALGLLKKGYRTARSYMDSDDENKKRQAGQTGPGAGPQPVNSTVIQAPVKPGKTRAQIASEEAAANKGTEKMTPEYQRPRRSILQGVKDKALERGATKEDPDNPGKRKKKGFGLGVAAKAMLGGGM